MKTSIVKILTLLVLLSSSLGFAQEWDNLRSYKKASGTTTLADGSWLRKDRKKQTEVWHQANGHNLNLENGYKKYRTTRQIGDFYSWFDEERIKQGHEIKWIGIALIAANQLSKVDIGFIRVFIVRNKELVKFVHEGSANVFAFAFPQLQEIYFSKDILKGIDAENWDKNYGSAEQCEILEPLYKGLAEKTYKKLVRMAKGKGIFSLGVPKVLKYEGKLDDCRSRFEHGINKLLPYYLKQKKF